MGNQPPVAEDISYTYINNEGGKMNTNPETADEGVTTESILERLGVDALNAGDNSIVKGRLQVGETYPVEGNTYLGGMVEIDRYGDFIYEPPAEAPGKEYVDTFTYAFTDWDVAADEPGDKESNEGTVYLHVGMDALTV